MDLYDNRVQSFDGRKRIDGCALFVFYTAEEQVHKTALLGRPGELGEFRYMIIVDSIKKGMSNWVQEYVFTKSLVEQAETCYSRKKMRINFSFFLNRLINEENINKNK